MMGNTCQSDKKVNMSSKEPDKFFSREKWKEQRSEEIRKKKMHPSNKRTAAKEPALDVMTAMTGPPPGPAATAQPSNLRSFDDETLGLMRYQLRNDADAFLLNNILLSVQFFENYERDAQNIKKNPISEREHLINEAMVRYNKHVFFADRLQDYVNEHVGYQKGQGQVEQFITPRLFVIYDNVEASEPGDTSDYSAVLDAPFYKLRIEDCKEPGFVKLKKMEVLESTLQKDNDLVEVNQNKDSDDSIYADSEKESNDSDDGIYSSKGEALLSKLKSKIDEAGNIGTLKTNYKKGNSSLPGRRSSGPIKQVSLQVAKSNINKLNELRKNNLVLSEEAELKNYINDKHDDNIEFDDTSKPRKSILKKSRRPSGPTKTAKFNKSNYVEIRSTPIDSTISEDTETSGYRSNSSRQNEISESESDYGYSTITEATTPKQVKLSSPSNTSETCGVLHDKTWTAVQMQAIDWSDDEEELDDTASTLSLSRNLYETHYYLCSVGFMHDFVDNFILNLGSVLGISQESISDAMTQGASIYCDTKRNSSTVGIEVFPALNAAWPNTANQWIIRERKIIQNPRTNFSYQWPTKYMVNKTIGFGCFLVPIGFRPKRGLNSSQSLQWKVTFPAAERYLESCLAHAHMRCYLFALALQKTFMDNETSKIGFDASHLKNHLFWQCEDNYAKWPEHRLGESLRLFLSSLYVRFGQGRFPNYFIENCNDFKSIPRPLLLKLQKRLSNILESPVMHVLGALSKLKYTTEEFYPPFEVHELYEILISKDPLRLVNPYLPVASSKIYDNNPDSDDDPDNLGIWDRAKKIDKNYQWKKEKYRQVNERRKAEIAKKRLSIKQDRGKINTSIILPARLEVERRRLVLEFFIKHFIAMARSSQKFDAIRQAVIYLEQSQRLCLLLKEEPAGESNATKFLDVIRDLLVDCQRKLVTQVGYKLPPRRDSSADWTSKPVINKTSKKNAIQDAPIEASGFSAFTFVDVHIDNSTTQGVLKLNDIDSDEEDSKL
ncbi:unnamed protein product [Chilo suppressalis]|uniref:Mab-21-like HhH/H2TH-like domain-containing protein n=1 Tax=Chilo suppressalis TaxID=168631 RepID=A0ABN8BDP3_CHISP|nr:unnamed protein product [Chilo suppressalis]